MADPTIKVEGVRELRSALKRIDGNARDLSRAHKSVAGRVVPKIAALTRRRSGKLAGAWRPGGTAKAATARNPTLYAPVQEYGWPARGIEPTRAVETVIRTERDAIVRDYEAAIADIIDRHMR